MGGADASDTPEEETKKAKTDTDESKKEQAAVGDKPAEEPGQPADEPMQDADKEPASVDPPVPAGQQGTAEAAGTAPGQKAEAATTPAAAAPTGPQRRSTRNQSKQEVKPASEQPPAAGDKGGKDEGNEDKEGVQQSGGKKGKGSGGGKPGGGKRPREEAGSEDGDGEGGPAEKGKAVKGGKGGKGGGKGGRGGGGRGGRRPTPEAREVSPSPAAGGGGGDQKQGRTRAASKAAHPDAANGTVSKEKGDEDAPAEAPADGEGVETKGKAAAKGGKQEAGKKEQDASVKEEEVAAITPGAKRAAAADDDEEEGRSSKKQKVTSPPGGKQGKGAAEQGETVGEGKGRGRLRRGAAAAVPGKADTAMTDGHQEAGAGGAGHGPEQTQAAEQSIVDSLIAYADPSSQQSKELGGLPTAARVKVLQEALQFLGKIGSGLEALVGTFYHDQFGVLKQSYDDIIDGGQEPLPKLFMRHMKKQQWTSRANAKAQELYQAWKTMSSNNPADTVTAAEFSKTSKLQGQPPAGNTQQQQAGGTKPKPAPAAGAQEDKVVVDAGGGNKAAGQQQPWPQKQPPGLQQKQQAGQQGGEQVPQARGQEQSQRQGQRQQDAAPAAAGAAVVGAQGSNAAGQLEPGLKAADGTPVPQGTVLVVGYPSTGDVVRDKAITLITCCLQSAQDMSGPLQVAQQVEAELHARYEPEDGGAAGPKYKLALHALWTLLDQQGAAGGVLEGRAGEPAKPHMNGLLSEPASDNLADNMRQLLLRGMLTPPALIELLQEMIAQGS